MVLSDHIYKYRTRMGLSQAELAGRLDVSRQSVSKWESGSAMPELDKVVRMAELFGVTLDELVMGVKPAGEKPSVVVKMPSRRTLIGAGILLVGVIFLMLSFFLGDQLRFGEIIGEMLSATVVLIGIAMVALRNAKLMAGVMVVYTLYGMISIWLHTEDLANNLFLCAAGIVIIVWFLAWGLMASQKQ